MYIYWQYTNVMDYNETLECYGKQWAKSVDKQIIWNSGKIAPMPSLLCFHLHLHPNLHLQSSFFRSAMTCLPSRQLTPLCADSLCLER